MISALTALLVAGGFRALGSLAWVGLSPLVFGTFAVRGVLGFLAHRTNSLGHWNLGSLDFSLAIGSLVWAAGSIGSGSRRGLARLCFHSLRGLFFAMCVGAGNASPYPVARATDRGCRGVFYKEVVALSGWPSMIAYA
jgi:hypothetical protein